MWAASPREIGSARPCQGPLEALYFLVRVSVRVSVRRVPRGSRAYCRMQAPHGRAASRRANVAQEGVCLA
jgi:hypothetical protein